MKRHHFLTALSVLAALAATTWVATPSARAEEGPVAVLRLTTSPGNPRNSEGDFVRLRDGRILFVYTHFTGGGGDDSAAHLAGRLSSDGGKTWTATDVPIVANTAGLNVMSVSLLRLANGEIALFYLVKNSQVDCRPVMRISTDEAKTWGEPVKVIPDSQIGYYVMNNDRAVQLKSGRVVAPVVLHASPERPAFDGNGMFMCYLSDDSGRTWRRSRGVQNDGEPRKYCLQEPGVIELTDGRLLAFCRTTHGSQYASHSSDAGETWTEFQPTAIFSPCSPASIERIPSTGDLLLVWNNHDKIDPALKDSRTPFNAAISTDEGKTWQNIKTIGDDRSGCYCYTAIEFVDDHVLLGHCVEDGLNASRITRLPIAWLYEKPAGK
ncbi:MAG: sialidase family protein [Planctomycetia bacterium]|nr:sialidase family protein [Planctomycetia bacterium]